MEYPRQITTIQAAAVLISTTIGVGVLPLPLFAVTYGDTGAPLVTVLAILLSFFGAWVVTRLGMRFPNQSIVGYSEVILGKWLAWIGIGMIILLFGIYTSLTSREFGEVVITSVLKKTPLEITVIIMLLLATMSSRNDMATFAYIHHFYLPVIMFPGILIVALSFKNSKMSYLLPVWGNGPSGMGMVIGVLTVAALFQGFFVITMVIPYMRNPKRAMAGSFWGLAISSGLYLMIVIAAVGVFGSEETKNLLWPTLELAKTTTLPGNILERLDAAFLAVWVTAVFTTLFSAYYFMIHTLSKLLRLRDHKSLSFFVLPFLFAAAMVPNNVLNMYQYIQTIGRFAHILTIGFPLLLLTVAVIRNKRGT